MKRRGRNITHSSLQPGDGVAALRSDHVELEGRGVGEAKELLPRPGQEDPNGRYKVVRIILAREIDRNTRGFVNRLPQAAVVYIE